MSSPSGPPPAGREGRPPSPAHAAIFAVFALVFALATAWTFRRDANRSAEKNAGPVDFASLRAHPGSLLRSHPVETFGCASCHRGAANRANGEAIEPLLRRGTLTRVLIDDQSDVLEARLGDGAWTKALLSEGGKPSRYATEADLFSAIEAQLPFASVRREGARVRIAARDRTSHISLRMKPGLAEVLGFAKTERGPATAHVADDAPSVPVRSDADGLTVPEEALDAFLLALPELEAGCGRCHAKDGDLGSTLTPGGEDAASTFTRGRRLFEELACGGCHQEGVRDPAPPLGELTAKLSPAWILQTIRDPRAASNGARMPSSWPPPIDPVTKRAIARRTPAYEAWEKTMREETLDVAAFLVSLAEDAPSSLRERVRGHANVPGASAEEGEPIFRASGCPRCHADVAALGAASNEDFIAYYVEDPARAWSAAKMPSLRLTRREAASVGKYLARNQTTSADEDAKALENKSFCATRAERGKAIVAREGCAGCHAIPGLVPPPAFASDLRAWGTRDVGSLDFGQAAGRADRTRAMFTAWKLDAPRLFEHDDLKLKMPDYALSAAEIRALTVYLEGRVGEPPSAPFDPSVGQAWSEIAEGRALLRRGRCDACHDSPDEGATPSLVGEGARVRPEWLAAFLKNPGALGVRPPLHPEWVYGDLSPTEKLAIRMPTYALSDGETTSLVRYVAHRDGATYPSVAPENKPRLTAASACMACHYAGAFPQERGKTELAKMAPNLAAAPERLRAEWLSSVLAGTAERVAHSAWTAPSGAETDAARDR